MKPPCPTSLETATQRVLDGSDSWSQRSIAGEVSPLVKGVWSYRTGAGAPAQYLSIPQLGFELLFAVRAGQPSVFLLGARNKAALKATDALDYTFSVQLAPRSAEVLFDVHGAALLGRAVPLRELWGTRADSLCSQLMEQRSDAARRDVIRTVLRPPCQSGLGASCSSALLERALQRMQRAPHEPIATLTNSLGVGERRLRRVFERCLGLSAATARRVMRVRRALALMARHPAPLAQLALAAGFFDQAHLTTEFQAFLDHTPSQMGALLHGPSALLLAPWSES